MYCTTCYWQNLLKLLNYFSWLFAFFIRLIISCFWSRLLFCLLYLVKNNGDTLLCLDTGKRLTLNIHGSCSSRTAHRTSQRQNGVSQWWSKGRDLCGTTSRIYQPVSPKYGISPPSSNVQAQTIRKCLVQQIYRHCDQRQQYSAMHNWPLRLLRSQSKNNHRFICRRRVIPWQRPRCQKPLWTPKCATRYAVSRRSQYISGHANTKRWVPNIVQPAKLHW